MINDLNINLFNYIFSINEDIRNKIKEDTEEYRKSLNSKIVEICALEDFWNEYRFCFNDKCVLIAKTLDGTIIRYNNFPRLTIDTKKDFLEYKTQQVEEIISNNGNLIREELEKIFIDIENLGRKTILDYCEEKGIIKYKGNPYFSASGNAAYVIIYENIEPIINKNYRQQELFTKNIVQNINYGNNYGTFNQSNNIKYSDEKLYEIILKKIDAMQLESNITKEKIESIKEACNKKEKNKVVNLLKEISIGTGTNLIANGILMMFGLM